MRGEILNRNQICDNARRNGKLEDPRITFDTEGTSDCGFKPKNPEYRGLPKVCGNCKNYTVQ